MNDTPGPVRNGPLHLKFDRGTILCSRWPEDFEPGSLPGMRWDPRVSAFRAPARCHARIQQHLAQCGIPVTDTVRAPIPLLAPIPSVDLRPYQEAALTAWNLADRRGVVVLPTGSGKTRVAMAAIAQLQRPALCLVPTRILLRQWLSAIRATIGIVAGCYGDDVREVSGITVATFESAHRHMHELGRRFDLLIVDEAHHFGSGMRDEALDMCTAPARLGLTATPPAAAAAHGLAQRIGPQVYELGIDDLRGSFLADYQLVELRLGLSPDESRDYFEAHDEFLATFDVFRGLAPMAQWQDFTRWAGKTPAGRAALQAWRRGRRILALTAAKNRAVAELLARHRDNRTLVFASDRAVAHAIARRHLIMPITADIGRAERDAMIAAFRRGEIRALVSARVLNEGFDVPDADVGIVVGGSLGAREHVQRVGRLLRPQRGKCAVVYELVTRGTGEVNAARRRRSGLGSRRPATV